MKPRCIFQLVQATERFQQFVREGMCLYGNDPSRTAHLLGEGIGIFAATRADIEHYISLAGLIVPEPIVFGILDVTRRQFRPTNRSVWRA